MRKLFAVILFLFSFPALAQTVNNVGDNTDTTAISGGQSNLLGNNIGSQVNNTTSTTTLNSTSVGAATPANTTAKVTTVPTVYSPGLTASGSDVCLGSSSMSLSVLGFGLGAGKTHVDENCVMLKNSQRVAALGFTGAAIVMMFQDKSVSSAFRASSPAIYLQVVRDRAANLRAEIEVDADAGVTSAERVAELAALDREISIIAKRISSSKQTEVSPSKEAVTIPESKPSSDENRPQQDIRILKP